MSSAICTLFEGHYHFGVAALTNSLYTNGFRGSVYVGYRGDLPEWTKKGQKSDAIEWENSITLNITVGLEIHFLPIQTDSHLTNYKPDFMLDLWNRIAKDADHLYYFDPDIVIVEPWAIFEEWVTCGVALNEDVNSPLEEYHPRRVAWRRYFGNQGINMTFKNSIYVNGGFVGLKKADKSFLELWIKVQQTMAPVIGGLNKSIFEKGQCYTLDDVGGPFMPFNKTDQDALNVAIEAYDKEVSYIGKEGMGFAVGFTLMYHALGNLKPWIWRPIIQLLNGEPPRNVDVEFWKYANSPIVTKSNLEVKYKRIMIKIARAFGRFYKRN